MLNDTQIAKIILEQLGGNKFVAMTGAKNFVVGPECLYFQIPKTNGITQVTITLDVNDTYRMEFSTVRKFVPIILSTHSNVYADQLQSIFTEQTGLATRL